MEAEKATPRAKLLERLSSTRDLAQLDMLSDEDLRMAYCETLCRGLSVRRGVSLSDWAATMMAVICSSVRARGMVGASRFASGPLRQGDAMEGETARAVGAGRPATGARD